MGLVNSTGFFQYIPPVPAINSLSKDTAELGEKVTIFGENLDYVDRLKFADEIIDFNLASENIIEFIVPENPSTGLLTIESDGINIVRKQLPFLPIFAIEEFSPTFGPSGETVTVNGKVLDSIISGDIIADPLDSDLDYLFINETRENQVYYRFRTVLLGGTGSVTVTIPYTGTKTEFFMKNSRNSDLKIIFNEFISKNSESGGYQAAGISEFTPNSGYISKIRVFADYASGNLLQDVYELHTYNFPKIDNDYIKSDISRALPAARSEVILNSNFADTGYGVFFNLIYTGTGIGDSQFNVGSSYGTIYDKTISGFRIEFSDALPYEMDLHYLTVKYGTGLYDSGFYRCGTVPFGVRQQDQINNIIDFENQKDYPLFVTASLNKIYPSGLITYDQFGDIRPSDTGRSSPGYNMWTRYYGGGETILFNEVGAIIISYRESKFFNHSIYELQNNSFKIDTSMLDVVGVSQDNITGKIYVDYLIVDNNALNLNNFSYEGTGSFYKKTLLFTGDASSFQKRIAIKPSNIKIQNKNTLKFDLPETNYHINGNLILINSKKLEKVSNQKFLETPLATKIEPDELYRGMPFLIRGKSFKKPILIDGTGYNEAIVRFDYQEQLYRQKDHDFEMNMKILDVNTLSGNIPVGNLPSGIYNIQMIDESRRIYE